MTSQDGAESDIEMLHGGTGPQQNAALGKAEGESPAAESPGQDADNEADGESPADEESTPDNKSPSKAEANVSGSLSSDTISQSTVEAKKDGSLFESLDDDIVLDTNTLQSIATDISHGAHVDTSLIGDDMTRQLAEIDKAKAEEANKSELKVQQMGDEPIVVTEVAQKIVDALTSRNVLGKVLTPQEADTLNQYFRGRIPLNEQVLSTLDTALDKILRRAPEFYSNKEELDSFLADPNNAKAQLLDALISKKSSFLVDLMGNANFYASMISKGVVDVYKLATTGILVACNNLDAAQTTVLQGCEYSKEMASKGVALTWDAARKGSHLVSSGVDTTLNVASASADLLANSATYAADTGIAAIGSGVQLTKNAAATGSELVSSGVNSTLNVATASAEVLSNSASLAAQTGAVAIGTSVALSRDVASKGVQFATAGVSGTMEVASKSANAFTRTASEASLTALRTGQAVGDSVGQSVDYSKQVASKGALVTYSAAVTGGAMLASGANVATQSAEVAAKATMETGKAVAEGISSAVTSTQQGLSSAVATTQQGLDATKDVLSSAGTNLLNAGSWFSSFIATSTTNAPSTSVSNDKKEKNSREKTTPGKTTDVAFSSQSTETLKGKSNEIATKPNDNISQQPQAKSEPKAAATSQAKGAWTFW